MLLFCITSVFSLCVIGQKQNIIFYACVHKHAALQVPYLNLCSAHDAGLQLLSCSFFFNFIITSSSLFVPLQLSDCNLYQVHAVNNID